MRQKWLLVAVGGLVFVGVGVATLPASLIVSRLPPQALPAPGTDLRLRADPAHLHFFDPADGTRLAA